MQNTHARTRGKTTPRACLVDPRCVCQTDSRHWSGLSTADRSFARRECARSLIFFPQRRGHFVRSVLASGSGPDFRFRVFSFVGSFAAPVSCTVRGFRLCVRRRRPGIVLRASNPKSVEDFRIRRTQVGHGGVKIRREDPRAAAAPKKKRKGWRTRRHSKIWTSGSNN